MSKGIVEHPSTALRREIEELKKRLDAAERSANVTEQVMVEMVHKHNAMKDHLIKLANMISQIETPKKKRPSKSPESSED